MPLNSTLHHDVLLSNVSVKYVPQGMIADQVFPVVPVKKDTDLFRIYERNWKLPETKRANKGLAREWSFAVSTSTYALEKHALKDYVTDDDADNYDIADLRVDTTEELTRVIELRKEKSVADLFATTAHWSQNLSLSAAQQFNGTTTANPIPIFDTAATTVIKQSGFVPNFGIITHDQFIACKNNAQILERIKYTSREMTLTMLQALFDLPTLLKANGVYDTAAEGVAPVITDIWADNCFVGYKPDSPGPLKPSSGYIFQKATPSVKRWRVEEREAEAIEVTKKFQAKVVASLSGFLIVNALA